MKEKIEINIILPYDLVANPGFSDAFLMDSDKWEQMKKEKERIKNVRLRKDKIEKIKNGINNK